jgi:hypothetical protein
MTNDEMRGSQPSWLIPPTAFQAIAPRGEDRQARTLSAESRWKRDFRSLIRFLLVLVITLALGACPGRRITKANVDEVAEGMSKKQVESILGTPTEIDNKDFVIMKKTTYVYRQGKDTVTIVFKDDKVTEKQSTLSD